MMIIRDGPTDSRQSFELIHAALEEARRSEHRSSTQHACDLQKSTSMMFYRAAEQSLARCGR